MSKKRSTEAELVKRVLRKTNTKQKINNLVKKKIVKPGAGAFKETVEED